MGGHLALCRVSVMIKMNNKIKEELLAMQQRDLEYRESIVKDGGLYDGYDEGMETIHLENADRLNQIINCLLYTSPSPRDGLLSRMPSSA